MLPALTIVPAGAGSGKTHTIQQWLGEWVAEGKVAPERIVAVTFTEAAAAELRERIRTKLLELGCQEDALKLDQAYISTIHGFGLRLLTEFAFELGFSPKPRLLNEDEENKLIRLSLSRTNKADAITSNLSTYGYNYDFNSGKSAEEMFRDDLLRIVSLLRSVVWKEDSSIYTNQSVDWIINRYGTTGGGEALTAELHGRVEQLLAVFPETLAREYGTNKTAKVELHSNFLYLQKASKGDALEIDWKLWESLRSLRKSKRGTPLPEDYDELADAVMAAADALPRHPGPLLHATTHIEALLAAGQDVLVHYADAKREAGLVDYRDMIAMAEEVLSNRQDVLYTLANRIDCLVVDEFQDTNPLQFALLWLLKEAGVPSLIVGDLKQAIMGFQGADPRLFAVLEEQNKEVSEPLTQNWRSQPRLMEFINTLGPTLFGEAYVSLEAKRGESNLEPLEAVSFSTKAKKDQHVIRAAFVGQRLKALLEDPVQQVVDRRTKESRQLRGGDMAVLCPTHNILAKYATVFRSLGLRVRLEEDGWFVSRAVQIAWHALAYVANPADRHAALYLAVTELGNLTLYTALRQLMEDQHISEPLLKKLDDLAASVADRTVYALVADTISALGLFDVVTAWPDGVQARANLLRLQAEAGEFMNANREAMASGGFHGSGVQSFLAWLSAKVQDDDMQPDPRVLDENAIELVTWHSSKGREWPVVSVCGMDRKIDAKLPNMDLGYTTFDDLSRLLEDARIEYSPKFAAPETNDRFLANLQLVAETESRRLLYVAITRARDKLLLEWPEYLTGKDDLTYWSILAQDIDLSQDEAVMKIREAPFPCSITEADSALLADLNLDSLPSQTELPMIGRRTIRPVAVPTYLTPDSVIPSGLETAVAVEPRDLIVERYGNGLDLEVGLTSVALGTFLHRCFEVLGFNPQLVDRLPSITGVEVDGDITRLIAGSVKQFETWLHTHFAPQSVAREVPLLSLDENGSIVSGTADLLVKTLEGVWIIDHKTDQVDDVVEALQYYWPQLESYAKALSSEGYTVLGGGINWIRCGKVVIERP